MVKNQNLLTFLLRFLLFFVLLSTFLYIILGFHFVLIGLVIHVLSSASKTVTLPVAAAAIVNSEKLFSISTGKFRKVSKVKITVTAAAIVNSENLFSISTGKFRQVSYS
jgi:hypothetical protein